MHLVLDAAAVGCIVATRMSLEATQDVEGADPYGGVRFAAR